MSSERSREVFASSAQIAQRGGRETRPVGVSSNATGNDEANVLGGNGGANRLEGRGGDDYLGGAGGDDLLIGGAGSDRLYGGAGKDIFQFDSLTGIDRILDFSRGETLRFDAAVFAALTPGTLDGTAFVAGDGMTEAQDADDRIVFDTASGALYYDADGAGGAAALQVAVLDHTDTLSFLGWGLTAASISVV